MELPPIEKRYSHGVVIVDVDRPYTTYVNANGSLKKDEFTKKAIESTIKNYK